MNNIPDSVIEALHKEFGWVACKHSFTFYKNDEVACSEVEVIGRGYIDFWCEGCTCFEYDESTDLRSELPSYGICPQCGGELHTDNRLFCEQCDKDYSWDGDTV